MWEPWMNVFPFITYVNWRQNIQNMAWLLYCLPSSILKQSSQIIISHHIKSLTAIKVNATFVGRDPATIYVYYIQAIAKVLLHTNDQLRFDILKVLRWNNRFVFLNHWAIYTQHQGINLKLGGLLTKPELFKFFTIQLLKSKFIFSEKATKFRKKSPNFIRHYFIVSSK